MPMKRTESPGVCSPGSPGWKSPITPCRFSPVRSNNMFDLPPSSTASLSVGTSGTPRHVRNGDPKIEVVGGGTPRRVHSRPNARRRRGGARMSQEEAWRFPYLCQQFVKIIRRWRSFARRNPVVGAGLIQQSVVGIIDQLAFLALLYPLHSQPQLLAYLVVRTAVEVAHPGVHINDRRDRVQR